MKSRKATRFGEDPGESFLTVVTVETEHGDAHALAHLIQVK